MAANLDLGALIYSYLDPAAGSGKTGATATVKKQLPTIPTKSALDPLEILTGAMLPDVITSADPGLPKTGQLNGSQAATPEQILSLGKGPLNPNLPDPTTTEGKAQIEAALGKMPTNSSLQKLPIEDSLVKPTTPDKPKPQTSTAPPAKSSTSTSPSSGGSGGSSTTSQPDTPAAQAMDFNSLINTLASQYQTYTPAQAGAAPNTSGALAQLQQAYAGNQVTAQNAAAAPDTSGVLAALQAAYAGNKPQIQAGANAPDTAAALEALQKAFAANDPQLQQALKAPDTSAALANLLNQYAANSFTPTKGNAAQTVDMSGAVQQLLGLSNQYDIGNGYQAKTDEQIRQQATSEYQSYYDQLRLAANQAASSKDLALMIQRAGLQDSYDKQRKQSTKDYTNAYIAADNNMLQRGMQRSSYALQTLANIGKEAAEAQQNISDAQTAAEGNIDLQRYQLASQLAEQMMGYDANQASDIMKRTFQLQDQEYDRSTADKQYRNQLASDLYSKSYGLLRDQAADSQWAQSFNESQRQNDNAMAFQNMQYQNQLASDAYNKQYQAAWDTANYNESIRQNNNALAMQTAQMKNQQASDLYSAQYKAAWDTANFNESQRQNNNALAMQNAQMQNQLASDLYNAQYKAAWDTANYNESVRQNNNSFALQNAQIQNQLATNLYDRQYQNDWATANYNESVRQHNDSLGMQNAQMQNSLASDIYNKMYQSYWDTMNYNEGVRQFNVKNPGTTGGTGATPTSNPVDVPAQLKINDNDFLKILASIA